MYQPPTPGTEPLPFASLEGTMEQPGLLPEGMAGLLSQMPQPAMQPVPQEPQAPGLGGDILSALLGGLGAGLSGQPEQGGAIVEGRHARYAGQKAEREKVISENVETQNAYNKMVVDMLQAGVNRGKAEQIAKEATDRMLQSQDLIKQRETELADIKGTSAKELETLKATHAKELQGLKNEVGMARAHAAQTSADAAMRRADAALNAAAKKAPKEQAVMLAKVGPILASVINEFNTNLRAGKYGIAIEGHEYNTADAIINALKQGLGTQFAAWPEAQAQVEQIIEDNLRDVLKTAETTNLPETATGGAVQ